MAGRILFGKKIALMEQYRGKYSTKQIEDFFGITIKSVGKREGVEKYNVYKDGELVLAEVGGWDVDDIFTGLIKRLSSQLEKEAELEDDAGTAKSRRMAEELERQEMQDEKENYETCPICFGRYLRGTHFH